MSGNKYLQMLHGAGIFHVWLHIYIYIHMYIYIPDAPCMEYLPLFTYIRAIFGVNVDTYSSTMEHLGMHIRLSDSYHHRPVSQVTSVPFSVVTSVVALEARVATQQNLSPCWVYQRRVYKHENRMVDNLHIPSDKHTKNF